MGFDFSKLLDVLKVGARPSAIAAVATGAVDFMPEAWLKRLGLLDLRKNHQEWMSVILIVALSSLLISLVISIGARIQRAYGASLVRKRRLVLLKELDGDEQTILKGSLSRKSRRFQTTPLVDAMVGHSLVEKAIVRKMPYEDSFGNEHFFIEDWAWDYLREHPELLK